MNIAYLGLGSNLGDSLRIIRDTWDRLGEIPGIQPDRLSHPYRTEPVDMASKNWFVNAAGVVRTTLPPRTLLARLHEIEQHFGRERDPAASEYLDRTLDLDLLLYDQQVIRENRIHIPHPRLPDRLFVLLPLCEIAPELRHPVLGRSMRELFLSLTSRGEQPAVKQCEWPATTGTEDNPQVPPD